MEKKSVLLISYDFPPIGGGGVQRNVKYMKYLFKLGWETHVLTIKERDFYVYDYSLLNEITETKIHKADSWDPASISYKLKKLIKRGKSGLVQSSKEEETTINESAWYVSVYRFVRDWFMFPDGFGGWIPFAYKKGKKLIKHLKPDVILITFPHPTNAILGYLLHRATKVPYVIDYRDAWLDDPYVLFPSIFHRKLHSFWEKKIMLNASAIAVYGEPLKDIFKKKYPNLKSKITVINNGFDPEDFLNLKPIPKTTNKIRIVYSGAVYVDRRQTYINFIQAFSELPFELKEKFEIIFVGDKLKWATELVEKNNLEQYINFTGYLSHTDALNYLAIADISLMFLKIGDTVALTGKIFEYLGLQLPVFACVEKEGACARLLKSIDHDQLVVSPSDIEGIKDTFIKIINNEFSTASYEKIEFFSRKFQSTQMNIVLNEAINNK